MDRPLRFRFFLLSVVLLAGLPLSAHQRRPPPTREEIAWTHQASQIRAALAQLKRLPPALPATEPGVTELDFAEFFGPVGARGLEYSDKLRALDGQRVRIAGYMVKQQTRWPGLLLLTPLPVATDEPEYGQCDELPASTLHVHVPALADRPVTLVPGRLVLTGRLELGPRPEADGRISVARLIVDQPTPADSAVAALAPAPSPALSVR